MPRPLTGESDPKELFTETERTMLDRLNKKYGEAYQNGSYRGRKFSRAERVPNGMTYGYNRIADYIAVSFWRSTGFEHIKSYWDRKAAQEEAGQFESTYALIGHEIKVSRSDWLHELKQPDKAEAWRKHCHEFYLVVSDISIVRDDLPENWGLMVPNRGNGLRTVKKAPRQFDPEPLPHDMMVSLLRATMQTEMRLAIDIGATKK